MPNHVENILRISGTEEDLAAFKAICHGKSPEYAPPKIPIPWGRQLPKEEVLTFSGIVPVPAEILAKTYDKAGYDWQHENWGTKWDAYGPPQVVQVGRDLIYTFQTAWAPPLKWLRAAVEKFPTLHFELFARDEYPYTMSVDAYYTDDGAVSWEECYGESRPRT